MHTDSLIGSLEDIIETNKKVKTQRNQTKYNWKTPKQYYCINSIQKEEREIVILFQ